MRTITIKKNGNLGACSECGDTTTKVVAVSGVPRAISMNGYVNIPFCDACFAASSWGKKVSA